MYLTSIRAVILQRFEWVHFVVNNVGAFYLIEHSTSFYLYLKH